MNKKEMLKISFIFLIFLTWAASAERNDCCPDKGPIILGRCADGEKTWSKTCKSGAYILLEDQYLLSENDTITLTYKSRIIEKDRYCLGSMENESEVIAIICFAALEPSASGNENDPLIAVSICCSISIICLSLTTIVYILLPKLRDLQGKCIMITIINLLFAFIILFILQRFNRFTYTSCLILAASMYFAFLSAFFWINIVAINIWRNTIRPQFLSNKYIFLFYNIYGWGSPLAFLTAALISHHVPGNHIKPGWTEYSCWFFNDASLIYFHIPILILFSMNIIMFISVGWKIWGTSANEQSTNVRIHKSRKYKCVLYLKLFLIMGITWIFEPISMIFSYDRFYLWIIMDYVNALQGVIIFLVLVVFRKRVRRDLARRGGILCGRLPKEWALIPDAEMEELEDSIDAEEPVQ